MTTDTSPTTAAATAFAADFAGATEADWRVAAEAALKGRPFDQAMRRRTLDGLVVDAIAPRAAPRVVAGRPVAARWTAMSRIDLADPAEANAQALEDLNNGASGLSISFRAPGAAEGLMADTLDRLDRALDGVLLDLAPIHLDLAPFEGRMTACLLVALIERRGLPPASVDVLFGIDMLRDLMRTGTLPRTWPDMCRRLLGVLQGLGRRGFTSPTLAIDARAPHAAGASEAQELAGALASATEHVRGLVAEGADLGTAADSIAFAFACDAEQFTTIAKLRAMRLLWAAWRRASGLPERAVRIHAETSRRMMTQRDPQTNMVRTTIAAFAAGVGGADSVTVLPHTSALGRADADARRIARNAQAIILEESYAHRVADPAAGAGAIEALTDKLAEAAWTLFREIERDGGLLKALTDGVWQERIAAIRAERCAQVATRKLAIVGVSEFPQLDEPTPPTPPATAPEATPSLAPLGLELGDDEAGFDAIVEGFRGGAAFTDIRAAWKPDPRLSATPLDLDRLSAPFEHLRARNESAAARPAAFLALLGPIARHSARAGFVRNLLAAGGIAATDGPIAAAPEAIADAFAASGARLAVVCGSDEAYAEEGAGVVAAVVARGATVWLAGRPKDGRDALAAAGVARFVAAGDDALGVLEAASGIIAAARGPAAGGAS